jgi:hypothetical protein
VAYPLAYFVFTVRKIIIICIQLTLETVEMPQTHSNNFRYKLTCKSVKMTRLHAEFIVLFVVFLIHFNLTHTIFNNTLFCVIMTRKRIILT